MTSVIINIENLVDSVTNYYDYYEDYIVACRCRIYRNGEERKQETTYREKWKDAAYEQIIAIRDILCLTTEQMERLWTVGKAIRKWRIATNYERLLSDYMKRQIMEYIFGKPDEEYLYYNDYGRVDYK